MSTKIDATYLTDFGNTVTFTEDALLTCDQEKLDEIISGYKSFPVTMWQVISNREAQFSTKFLNRYHKELDWRLISKTIKFDHLSFDTYLHLYDWGPLTAKAVPEDVELIRKYRMFWNWRVLSEMRAFSREEMLEFMDDIVWEEVPDVNELDNDILTELKLKDLYSDAP